MFQKMFFVVACGALSASASEMTWLEPDTTRALTQLTGQQIQSGNQIDLLINGKSFFPVRMALIEQAKRTIDLGTFLWCDDFAGFLMAKKLIEAKNRGVKIRVYVDFFNLYRPHEKVYKLLRKAGIDL